MMPAAPMRQPAGLPKPGSMWFDVVPTFSFPPDMRRLHTGSPAEQNPVEFPDRGRRRQVKQVRRTPAIGAAELCRRCRGLRISTDRFGPKMLCIRAAAAHPDFRYVRMPAEVIDVPAALLAFLQMTADSGRKATRAPRTADIDIAACRKCKSSQAADLNAPTAVCPQDQRVHPFIDWLQRRLQKILPPCR